MQTMKETVKSANEAMEVRLTAVEVERRAHFREVHSRMERFQQKLREAENRPTGSNSNEVQKELKFDGSSLYPIEFLINLLK